MAACTKLGMGSERWNRISSCRFIDSAFTWQAVTTKIQALIAACVTGAASFVSWLATVPPEQQSGLLAQFVEIVPVTWRPGVGLAAKALGTFSTIYAVYKASHSGPQSPPKNSPLE